MNRKQKIIVSTTGIFLVLLILVGLTYAYFLTRINGNKNDKSISVSTANLELVYADVNDTLISATNIEPGVSFTKIFSATNNGNKKIDEYGVALENVINTLERTEDLVYTISCTQYLKQGYSITKDGNNYIVNGTTSGTCNGVSEEQIFPTMGKILVTNSIEDDKVQVYTLVVTYKDTGTDQSIDMNKQFSAKVNLVNPSTFGVLGSGTLASMIIENGADVKISDTETKNTKIIKTTVNVNDAATGSSWSDEINDFTNDGLFRTIDDYGSAYYFRGPVTNNYIDFAGMCWRIVRVSGDESIKLILEDQYEVCSNNMAGNWDISIDGRGLFGYTKYDENTLTASDGTKNAKKIYVADYLTGKTNSDKSMATAFKKFQTGPLLNYLSYLKVGDWCLNDKAYATETNDTTPLTSQEISDKQIKGITYYYDSHVRLKGKKIKEPKIKCNGTIMTKFDENNSTNMYVGALTADEVVYSGKYLTNNYQINNYLYFWTLSPDYYNGKENYDYIYLVTHNSVIYSNDVWGRSRSLRPSINLKSGIKITSGNGTSSNPYTVKLPN